ncbi:MAG TPA: methionyl-tRNA formyltransferase [Thioalkalivibrio sp.]|nr:methionyl-tRNA formyltransferase [Thioalkalivibrio sp.]
MSESLRIVYAGTPDFAVPALQALIDSPHEVVAVYTQPDRPAGRGRKLKASPVKAVALEHGIAVEQPPSLRDAAAQARLAAYAPDLMVVAAYGLILPQAVLDIPRLGCLNIHGSLLPRWRGAAPIQRAILAGDAETGITIMQMDAGLDTGGMLLKRAVAIEPGMTAQALHDTLAGLGAEALLSAIAGLQDGSLKAEPQDDGQATYAEKLSKDEASIDWTRPAEAIARQVCAFNPWPVAQTTRGGEPLRLWEAQAVPGEGPPGKVVAEGPEGIDIACGEGLLRVTRLQLPGGRPLAVRDFLNGRSLAGELLPS